MNQGIIKTEVCVIGAGPAGSVTALFLAKKGISCILADKAEFPRDKICGDGVSGWVVSVLAQLDQDLLLKLNRQPFLLHSFGMRIGSPKGDILDLPFLDTNQLSPDIPPGYLCKRIDFDNFLLQEARTKEKITVMENTEITGFKTRPDGIVLSTRNGQEIHAQIAVFANGANSAFMKDPGGISKDRKFTMTGIRAYYRGITKMHEKNYVELHFLKNLLPGYFWIFPLPNGEANVGVGIDQETISRKRLNLKKLMNQAVEEEPHLHDRFRSAEQLTPIQAYNLPLWDKRRRISGERFMLAGDTASLIDPVTGEGMGHAALCGMYAAAQAERSLAAGNFSAAFMEQYDRQLYEKIGTELNISSKVPRFIKHAWLFNAVLRRASGSKVLQERLAQAMTDLEVRKKLKNPMLYLKIILGG